MFFPKPPTAPPAQDPKPVPKSGGGRIWYVLTTHFSKLICCNLLFVLFSLPLLTLPAALAGLTAVIESLYRKGHCFVWETFFREFRTELLLRTILALVLVVLPVGGWFLGAAISELMAYGLSAILLVLVLLTGSYWFPQLALLTLGCGQCLKNALLLTVLETKSNLLLLLIAGITAALIIIPWPFSAPFLALIFPALAQLLSVAVVNPILDERLVQEDAQDA